jgi:hypothetical protein
VDVDPAATAIDKHDAARPLVPLGQAVELGERLGQTANVAADYGEVQVVVSARLHTEQGVHAPPAMDPPADARFVEPIENF